MEKEVILKDKKGRDIIKINDHGELAVARYVDMSEPCKEYVVEVYSELTGADKKKIMEFLNFESDDGEFCS